MNEEPAGSHEAVALLAGSDGEPTPLYKDNTILRRIERRRNIHQIATMSHYLRYVQLDPAEGKALFQELLIGVTTFFRDRPVFDALAQSVPQLLDGKPEGYTIRAWVPACSTGEEAYSLAMLLQEYANRHKRRLTFQVFGTDIDADAIVKARQGLYPEGIATHVSPARLKQFFVKEDSHYRVNGAIRDRITFAPHNVLKDPPFTKVDVLLCRNLLIYLRQETQRWLLPLFHYALKPNGTPCAGKRGNDRRLYDPVQPVEQTGEDLCADPRPGLPLAAGETARSRGAHGRRSQHAAPAPAVHRPSYLVESIHAVLLDRFVPPGRSSTGRARSSISTVERATSSKPAPGPASQQVVDMARPDLRRDLIAALQLADKQGGTVVRKGIRMQTKEKALRVTLTVTPLYKPEVLEGLLLVNFEPESGHSIGRPTAARHAAPSDEAQGVTLELEYTQQRLQRANEELQLSNEEFRIGQRRVSVDQRGAAEHERRTGNDERGAAIAQRRTRDGQHAIAEQAR